MNKNINKSISNLAKKLKIENIKSLKKKHT